VTIENELVQMVLKDLFLKRMVENADVDAILTLKLEIQTIIVYAESDKLN
jgi:hypothetical protein